MRRATTKASAALERIAEDSGKLDIRKQGGGRWLVGVVGSPLDAIEMTTHDAFGFSADIVKRYEPHLRDGLRFEGEVPMKRTSQGLIEGFPAHQADAVRWLAAGRPADV